MSQDTRSNVIELFTRASAGLGCGDDAQLPEEVLAFDELLGATLMLASTLAGIGLSNSPAVANLLFAYGALLIRAYRTAVAYCRDAAAAELDAELARLEEACDQLAGKADRYDAIERRFPALLHAIEDNLPPGRLPLDLALEVDALAAVLDL